MADLQFSDLTDAQQIEVRTMLDDIDEHLRKERVWNNVTGSVGDTYTSQRQLNLPSAFFGMWRGKRNRKSLDRKLEGYAADLRSWARQHIENPSPSIDWDSFPQQLDEGGRHGPYPIEVLQRAYRVTQKDSSDTEK